ncbi:hypothetical protein [Terrabacter sp. 2YAF2]|uniref:hypothetical protein n=1 Tax=Terrabacter sp. 2YAF2 TaxID=3233026 RepID=UPI003F9D0FCA
MRRRTANSWILAGLLGLALGACASSQTPSPGGSAPAPAFSLSTHCGIDDLQIDGQWYERQGGRLVDDDGNPPNSQGNPWQVGTVVKSGSSVTFTDSAGHRETFTLRRGATGPKKGCA